MDAGACDLLMLLLLSARWRGRGRLEVGVVSGVQAPAPGSVRVANIEAGGDNLVADG